MTSTRGVFIQAVAALLVTIVLLLGIELMAGFVVGRLEAPPEYQGSSKDTVTQTLRFLHINSAPLVKDVDLLWRNEPLARRTQPVNPRPYGRDDHWTVEINSEGFRGPERPFAGRDDVLRILCIGDSVTFGFNVDQGNSYPQALERVLQVRYPGLPLEVVNAGVPGWSWLQGLKFLETRGLALDPDLVVIAHGVNDQLMTATVTDEERLQLLAGPLQRARESLLLTLAETNAFRLVDRLVGPPRDPDELSSGCARQVAATGHCKRVSVPQIEAAVLEVERVTSKVEVDLLVLNLDFLETAAVRGTRAALARRQFAFVDVVEHIARLRRVDEGARAARLGLAAQGNVARLPAVAEDPPSWGVLLRVLTPTRRGAYRVEGGSDISTGFTFSEPLYDDGTHGDERADDGVYSAIVRIPHSAGPFRFKFYVGDVAEFTPLPPMHSTFGDRLLRTAADMVSPVFVFGELLFMAERTHPNEEGQRIVAERVAAALSAHPALQRLSMPSGTRQHEAR